MTVVQTLLTLDVSEAFQEKITLIVEGVRDFVPAPREKAFLELNIGGFEDLDTNQFKFLPVIVFVQDR